MTRESRLLLLWMLLVVKPVRRVDIAALNDWEIRADQTMFVSCSPRADPVTVAVAVAGNPRLRRMVW